MKLILVVDFVPKVLLINAHQKFLSPPKNPDSLAESSPTFNTSNALPYSWVIDINICTNIRAISAELANS